MRRSQRRPFLSACAGILLVAVASLAGTIRGPIQSFVATTFSGMPIMIHETAGW